MEGVLLALVGVIGTMVAGSFWFLKFLSRKLFGRESSGDRGIAGEFMERFSSFGQDLRENTAALKLMQTSQNEANQTLTRILDATKAKAG